MRCWTKSAFVVFCIAVCIVHGGCLAKFPHFAKEPPREEPGSSSDEVVLDSFTPSTGKTAERSERKPPKTGGANRSFSGKEEQPQSTHEKPSESSSPEEEGVRVRKAAIELAKTLGEIEKMKICYSSKDKEWWGIFYQTIVSGVDVRQFIWNPEKERFEPFLVMRRIPKSKLDSEARRNETDKTCTQVPLPAPDK
jgi:hypothetical protein